MHEVLVNRLGGLNLPRKSVVRLTDRPDMTLDVYRGRKTTMQQQQPFRLSFRKIVLSTNYYKIMIGSLTSADILLKRTSIRKSSIHPSISRIPFLFSVGSPFIYFILIKSIQDSLLNTQQAHGVEMTPYWY